MAKTSKSNTTDGSGELVACSKCGLQWHPGNELRFHERVCRGGPSNSATYAMIRNRRTKLGLETPPLDQILGGRPAAKRGRPPGKSKLSKGMVAKMDEVVGHSLRGQVAGPGLTLNCCPNCGVSLRAFIDAVRQAGIIV